MSGSPPVSASPARPLRAASLRRGRPPSRIIGEFTDWMKRDSLPFWTMQGWDAKHGGFHERCDFKGRPDVSALRRTRVQWRQIYVLAHASMLGWTEGLRLAFQGLEHMLLRAWSPDGKPGFVEVLNPDGSVAKAHRDAYDHAFALLALGWLARASGDAQVKSLLDVVFAFVREELTDAKGFLIESLPPALPRRQNPHMHMFEAMLALAETVGHPDSLTEAARYRRMLEKTFIDRKTRLLLEFFDDDWKPVEENGAAIVEPGHMAEWVWLLRKHDKMLGEPPTPLGTHFLGAALRAAEPTHGFLIDEIDTLSQPRKVSRRLWPQTELIKAWLAQAETGADRADEAAEKVIEQMMKTYLAGPFAGGWYDQFDGKGEVTGEFVPASSLYHIFVAVAEANRVLG
ncbi:MAG: AGE family epimerase/isomerase [Beijerinckiaceae bacterium]|nr:AGE family epimerase/isomerase [Beijerinckiaceae bacterium]